MTLSDRYLQGWGLSLLVHAVLACVAAWLWFRPADKPKTEQPLRWEVSMFGTPPPPKQPLAEPRPLQQPELAAEPPVETLLASDIPAPAGASASSAPAFDMPKAMFSGGGATVVGVPAPGTATLWPAGPVGSGPGIGAGDRSLDAPDFGFANTPLVRVDPELPMEARRKKISGWARVEFTIMEDGSVANARVIKAEPPGIFDQTALAAIVRWKFPPAVKDGKRVRRRLSQPFRFNVEG